MLRKIKFSNSPLKQNGNNQFFIVRFLAEKSPYHHIRNHFYTQLPEPIDSGDFPQQSQNFLSTSAADPNPVIFRQLQKTALVQVDRGVSSYTQQTRSRGVSHRGRRLISQ